MATPPLVAGQSRQPQMALIGAGLQVLQKVSQGDVQIAQGRQAGAAPITGKQV
jgi:hypothetical protein